MAVRSGRRQPPKGKEGKLKLSLPWSLISLATASDVLNEGQSLSSSRGRRPLSLSLCEGVTGRTRNWRSLRWKNIFVSLSNPLAGQERLKTIGKEFNSFALQESSPVSLWPSDEIPLPLDESFVSRQAGRSMQWSSSLSPHNRKVGIFLKQFLHYCFSASSEASLPSATTTVIKLYFVPLFTVSHSSLIASFQLIKR